MYVEIATMYVEYKPMYFMPPPPLPLELRAGPNLNKNLNQSSILYLFNYVTYSIHVLDK